MIKKFKPPKIKTIPIRFNLDSDKDGVPDWRDCRPFNPKKHYSEKEDDKLRRIGKWDKARSKHVEKIIKEHPEAEADIYMHVYDTEHPTSLDPLVKPVVRELYRKGYKSVGSCQGHGKEDVAYIQVQIDDRLIVALMRAGFVPAPYGSPGYIMMECNEPLTEQQRKNLWKRALEEVKKI